MRKMQKFIVKDNRIFVGLEDSKRQWKVCVRCDGIIVHPDKQDIGSDSKGDSQDKKPYQEIS